MTDTAQCQASVLSRSMSMASAIAAGHMLRQLTRWLRILPTDCDPSLNLLASELSCQETRRIAA